MIALLNSRTWKTLGVGLVGLFMWGGTAWGQAPLLVLPPANLTPGTTSQGFVNFHCYDIETFLPVNCVVTATLGPLDPATTTPPFFGGHVAHLPPQPLGKVRNAKEPPSADDVSVKGNTLNGFTVVYTAPEASGQVQFVTTWTFPPFYLCLDRSSGQFRRICTDTDHLNVGLSGLQDLPPNPSYIVSRDRAQTHPRGTSGTPATNDSLARLALLYFVISQGQRTLSINDMSLPQGGLFDIAANWAPDHKTHRRGIQADINQEGIDCLNDVDLQAAVRVMGARRLCEPGGNKHITFNR